MTAGHFVGTLKTITELKTRIEGEKIVFMGRRGVTTRPLSKACDLDQRCAGYIGSFGKAANDLVQAFTLQGILIETTGNRRTIEGIVALFFNTTLPCSTIYKDTAIFHIKRRASDNVIHLA